MTAPFIFDQPNQPDAEAQRLRATLNALVDMAADIARATHTQIMALPEPGAQPSAPSEAAADPEPRTKSTKPAPNPLTTLAASFDETARTARQCVMLLQRLAEAAKLANLAEQRNAARRRIIREVEDAIQREVEGEAALNFGYELDERLDLLDVNREITSRPPQEIITEILRDFGLTAIPGTRPWKRRTPPEIIELNVWAADPPKPFMPRQFAETAEPGRSGPRSERP